jgi:hypothetical protein
MKIKCQIQLMLSLASAMSLLAAGTALPGQAAEVTETSTQTTSQTTGPIINQGTSQTTTQVIQPGFSQPTVVDSWMQPAVTRTKSVTSSDGSVEKTIEPMIMERHETVVVPTEAKVTTTTSVTPAQVTEVTMSAVVKTAVVKRPVVRKKRYVKRAYRRTPRRQQAVVRHTAQTKTVVAQPQIIQQRQTIEQKSILITRPDPALKFN